MHSYPLTAEHVQAASAQILAAVASRNGPPDHTHARTGDPTEDAFLAWESGTWFRFAQEPGRWLIGVREKDRAWPAPTWLVFERAPDQGDAFRQLAVGDFDRPALAIGEDYEVLDLASESAAAAIREVYATGAYFLSNVDMTREHVARRGEGIGRQPCELCQGPVDGGEVYVERVHRQDGDQRRAHLACAQRAIDVVARGRLAGPQASPPTPEDIAHAAEGGPAPDAYYANYVHEQSLRGRVPGGGFRSGSA